MRLNYLLITLLLLSFSACVSDTNSGNSGDTAVAQASSAAQAPAKAPQVKVNADSPAFQGKTTRSAPKTNTPTQAVNSHQSTNEDPSSQAYKDKMSGKNRIATPVKVNTPQTAKTGLPDACKLVTEDFLGRLMGVDPGYINVKDGSGRSPSANQRPCFFKWDSDDQPNAGVLVQIQTNPLPPGEFPDWSSYFISAKKNHGDKSPDGETTFRYKDFNSIGVSGAYSSELSRYYWRDEQERVFMVAFNIPSTPTQQMGWAERISKEVMKNAN